MNEEQRELLLDIFENTEAPEKIKIILYPTTRDVTIVYEDCDDEWFRELQAAEHSVQADGAWTCPKCNALYGGELPDNCIECGTPRQCGIMPS